MPRRTHQTNLSTPSTPSTFTDGLPLPIILVFDLDYTLWPFWVDTHVSGNLKPASSSLPNTAMIDHTGQSFAFYADVSTILHSACERNIPMAVASRTHAPDLARQMLAGLQVPAPAAQASPTPTPAPKALELFISLQIFPGSKVAHLHKIQGEVSRKLGRKVEFSEMLFFDDEARNRDTEQELGVCFWLVPDGVSAGSVDDGVREWRRRKGMNERQAEGVDERAKVFGAKEKGQTISEA